MSGGAGAGSKGASIEECFRTLDLPPTTSAERIKAAFRKQAKRWHPDKQARGVDGDTAAGDNDAATRKFRAARAAHDQLLKHAEVLSYDAEDRRFIEQTIRELVKAQAIQPTISAFTSPTTAAVSVLGTKRKFKVDYTLVKGMLNPASPQYRSTLWDRTGYPSTSDVFSKFTMASHELYWSVPITGRTAEYTAFVSPSGAKYEWTVLGKQIPGAAHHAQTSLQAALKGIPCRVAGHEFVVHSASAEAHSEHVKATLNHLMRVGIKTDARETLLGATLVQVREFCLSGGSFARKTGARGAAAPGTSAAEATASRERFGGGRRVRQGFRARARGRVLEESEEHRRQMLLWIFMFMLFAFLLCLLLERTKTARPGVRATGPSKRFGGGSGRL